MLPTLDPVMAASAATYGKWKGRALKTGQTKLVWNKNTLRRVFPPGHWLGSGSDCLLSDSENFLLEDVEQSGWIRKVGIISWVSVKINNVIRLCFTTFSFSSFFSRVNEIERRENIVIVRE